MRYYGIYFNNEYKVTKRETMMANNREWFKKSMVELLIIIEV